MTLKNAENRIGLLGRWPLLLLMALWSSCPVMASSPAGAPSQVATTAEIAPEISIGIAGHVRLGHWTEVRLPLGDYAPEGWLVIRADDPDGIPVDYRWPMTPIEGVPSPTVVGYFRLGRPNQPITVRIESADQNRLFSQTIDLVSNPRWQVHPATQPFWLSLGQPFGIDSATTSLRRSEDAGLVLIQPESVGQLPLTARGWSSLDRLIGNTAGGTWSDQFTPQAIDALTQWLQQGGRISLLLDVNSIPLIQAGGALAAWSGELKAVSRTTGSSSAIEYFVGSRTQLLEENAVALPFVAFPDSASTELEIDNEPAIFRGARGFGQLDLLGLDLTAPPFVDWPSRPNLINKWLQLEKPSTLPVNTAYGYSDLTGQLRSALDQFSAVQLLSFTSVAGILLTFLLLVAGDYFLMRHVLKRMEMTWVTVPIYCLLTCGAVYWLFQSAKSPDILVNQAEIIDINSEGSTVQSRSWANIYSPVAQNLDVSVGADNVLDAKLDRWETAWNGLAGSGMGGMMSTNFIMGSQRPYTIAAVDRQPSNLKVSTLPFDVASTRSVISRWQGTLSSPIKSNLTRRAGRDRLYGTFTNPLPVEMKDCFIIHGGWAYQLRSTMLPGASIDVASQTDLVALSVWLNRRKSLSEKSSTNQPWDIVDDDIQRILEMMMFYQIGGGQEYTGLLNQYESRIDFSELRKLDRAIFLGRVDEAVTEIQLGQQTVSAEQRDRISTAIRILLPVQSEVAE